MDTAPTSFEGSAPAPSFLLLFVCGTVLLWSSGVASDAPPSVMDTDGDGKVSTEEFMQQARDQQKVTHVLFPS